MSTETVPATQAVPTTETHVEESHEIGGPPVIENYLADDVPVEASSEVEETQEQTPDDPSAEVLSTLRQENTQLRGIVDQIRDEMSRDPALAKRLSQGPSTEEEGGSYSQLEKVFRDPEAGLKPEAADVVLRGLKPIADRMDSLEADNRELRAQLTGVSAKVGSTEFVSTLTELGVSPAAQQTKPFQRMLNEVKATRGYKAMEIAGGASLAAEFVANKWIAQSARAGINGVQRQVLDTARNGKSGSVPARGASLAQKIIEVVRDGRQVDKADAIRMQHVQAGKPLPKIVYVDRLSKT